MKLYKNIQTRDELERELLRIVRKMNPMGGEAKAKSVKTVDLGLTEIGIVRQPFTEVDKQYWKQFHISTDTLKRFNVFSIKKIVLCMHIRFMIDLRYIDL